MTYEEVVKDIEKFDGKDYILYLNENVGEEVLQRFMDSWRAMNKDQGTKRTVLIVPSDIKLTKAHVGTFNFSIALRLLALGYKLARTTWTEGGYIYQEDSRIMHSNGREWTATQGSIMADNWRVVKS